MLEHTSADTQAAAAAAATLHLRITIVGRPSPADCCVTCPSTRRTPAWSPTGWTSPSTSCNQHFPSWDGLVLAARPVERQPDGRGHPRGRRRPHGRPAPGDRGLERRGPALMRLLVALLSVAGTPRTRWPRTCARATSSSRRRSVAASSTTSPSVGRPTRWTRAAVPSSSSRSYEGLQLQAMLRSDLDLVPAFDRAVARLERGWMERYEPQAAARFSRWSDGGSWEI